MRHLSVLASLLLTGALVTPVFSAGFPAGELSVLGSHSTGDFGSSVDSSVESLTVRYITDGKLQFRVDLPLLRVESGSFVTHTGSGWVSMGRRPGEPPGSGPSAPDASEGGSWNNGIGDLRLGLARRVAGGGVRIYRVDAVLEVKVPTADEREGLGTGEWDYRAGLSGQYRFWSFSAFGGIGWNRFGDPAWVELNDVFDGYAGLESDPLARERLILAGWIEGSDEVVEGVSSRTALGIGLRTTGKIRWQLAASAGIGDAAEDLAIRLGLAFGISPSGPGIRGVQR